MSAPVATVRQMDFQVFRGLLLFAATALAVWAFGLILSPFIVPIAWALCLCATTAGPYRWLVRKTRKPRLAAFLLVLATGAVVLAPMIGISALVVEQANHLDFDPTLKQLKEHMPGLVSWSEDTLAWFNLGSLESFLGKVQEQLPGIAARFFGGGGVRGAINVLLTPIFFLFGLLLTLVTQYFVYHEAARLRRLVVQISPLPESDTDRILLTLRGTTAAAIAGGLLVALIQGLLGGIMFAVAGIQSPAVWAVFMAALSLLPFGGTAIVWAPVGVYLLLTGDAKGGWFILVFGTVIVGSADNLLRPWILSRTGADDIHPMLLFFAILSGIGLFGMSGVVFGPLLLALLMAMMRIYRDHLSVRAPVRPGPEGESVTAG